MAWRRNGEAREVRNPYWTLTLFTPRDPSQTSTPRLMSTQTFCQHFLAIFCSEFLKISSLLTTPTKFFKNRRRFCGQPPEPLPHLNHPPSTPAKMPLKDEYILPAAADMHVHLRNAPGPIAELVTPTIRPAGVDVVFVMPNLAPRPVVSVDEALEYKRQLQAIDSSITYLMSLYLHSSITPDEIRKAKKAGIAGVKVVPPQPSLNRPPKTHTPPGLPQRRHHQLGMGRPLLRPLPRRPQGHGRRGHRPQPARRSPQQPRRRRDRHERRVQVPPDAARPRIQVPEPQDRPRALHHGRRGRDGPLFRGECRWHHRTPLPSPIMSPTNTIRPPTTSPSSSTTGPPTWYVPPPPPPPTTQKN